MTALIHPNIVNVYCTPRFSNHGTAMIVKPPAAKYRVNVTKPRAEAAYRAYESMMYMYTEMKRVMTP